MLSGAAAEAYRISNLADVVYADDTLLLGTSSAHVEEFLHCVAKSGSSYGLQLHPDKLQLLQVNCKQSIRVDMEHSVDPTESMTYLGSVLAPDGHMSAELSRRIGMAKGEFRAIRQVWSHSNLSMRRKLEIFSALIGTKLLYSLAAGCFTKAELRRLDGFQAKCLRAILGIAAPFISLISNESVRRQASFQSIFIKLSKQQLLLLGRELRQPDDQPLHRVSFVSPSMTPLVAAYMRRVGRPRQEFAPSALQQAARLIGDSTSVFQMVHQETEWKRYV